MGLFSKLFATASTTGAFRTTIDDKSARLTTLTEFNNHDRCLALLVPSVKFAQDAPPKTLKRFTSDSCVFELIVYIIFSTDFWQFNNQPELRDKIQVIISKQVATLCAQSGLLTEEEAFDYLSRRLAVYGSIVSEGGDAQALHLRLKQALLHAVDHSFPQQDTMDRITFTGAFDSLVLSKELIQWDMLRMKLMGSILPHMD